MSLRSAADPNYARPLTRLIDRAAGPLDFAGYEAENGYAAFRKVRQRADACRRAGARRRHRTCAAAAAPVFRPA